MRNTIVVAISLLLGGCAEPAQGTSPSHVQRIAPRVVKERAARIKEIWRELDEAERLLRDRPGPYRQVPSSGGE